MLIKEMRNRFYGNWEFTSSSRDQMQIAVNFKIDIVTIYRYIQCYLFRSTNIETFYL